MLPRRAKRREPASASSTPLACEPDDPAGWLTLKGILKAWLLISGFILAVAAAGLFTANLFAWLLSVGRE